MPELSTAPKSAEKKTRLVRWALALTLLLLYTTLGVVRDIVNVLRASGHLSFAVSISLVAAGFAALGLALRVSARPGRALLALALSVVPYLAMLRLMARPEERIHLVEYGLVGVLAYFAFPHQNRLRRHLQAVAFVLAAGWVDEGIQALLPSRMYDLRDVAFNFTAGVLALISLALVQQLGARGAD